MSIARGGLVSKTGIIAHSLRNGCKKTVFKFLTSEASLMMYHLMKINGYNFSELNSL
jgi:hypothetical protein